LDIMVIGFMLFLGIGLSFLAFYLDNPVILGFAGVVFLLIGIALIAYEPTKVVALSNETKEVTVSWPFKSELGIVMLLFGIVELYSTYFSSRRGV